MMLKWYPGKVRTCDLRFPSSQETCTKKQEVTILLYRGKPFVLDANTAFPHSVDFCRISQNRYVFQRICIERDDIRVKARRQNA